MGKPRDAHDPKALIYEAYRIDGITASQCRSIFLDWALSLPDTLAPSAAIEAMLARYGEGAPEHPMTQVLREGLQKSVPPKRRGGWRSRERP